MRSDGIPSLFPHEPEWRPGLEHDESKRTSIRFKMTLLQFYAHRFALRHGFGATHSAWKLFQQFAVDAYVKVEANNLNYIKLNQQQLRVEYYQGLMDLLTSNDAGKQGKIEIYPSSFAVI